MAKPEMRPDIAAAAAAMKGAKIGSNREIRKLEEYLAPGESVRRIAAGHYANGQGLLALTDRRLFFLKDGIISKTSEDFPFGRVTSVGWRSGMVHGTVVIFANGNEAKIGSVYKDDGKALVEDARQVIDTPAHATAPPAALAPAPAPASEDIMGRLRQLAELRDAGVITGDDFDAKKTELLARL